MTCFSTCCCCTSTMLECMSACCFQTGKYCRVFSIALAVISPSAEKVQMKRPSLPPQQQIPPQTKRQRSSIQAKQQRRSRKPDSGDTCMWLHLLQHGVTDLSSAMLLLVHLCSSVRYMHVSHCVLIVCTRCHLCPSLSCMVRKP